MNERGLEALRQALQGAAGPHVDEETLAEIATAEAAGEEVERRFSDELEHIESCVHCAESYYELVELTLDAITDMSAAARAVSPLNVYASLLQGALEDEAADPALARRLAAALPAHFTAPPAGPEAVSPEIVGAAWRQVAAPEEETLREGILRAVRRHLTALALYLESTADRTWGQAVEVTNEATGRAHALHLSPAPGALPATPAIREPGPQWDLSRQQVGQPPPLTITIQAERLSPLACRLLVRTERPDRQQVAGREVRLRYAGQERRAHTDEQGVVRFAPLPIAALVDLSIYVEAE